MALSICFLAISLSLDALSVGLAYGIKNVRIPFISKLIICFCSIIYSGISLLIGNTLFDILPDYISKVIGVLILIFMGVWLIVQAFKNTSKTTYSQSKTFICQETVFKVVIKSLGITIKVIKNPLEGDIDSSGIIDRKESVLLGLALSMDSIGVTIGSALSGFSSMSIPFAIGFSQLMFIYAGLYMGKKFNKSQKINQTLVSILPGTILILLALFRIWG